MSRVNIRPISVSDLDNIMSWVNDPEVVGKFAELGKPKTREEEADFLEKIVLSETDALFAVETERGKYVGNIGLHQIDGQRKQGRLAVILGNKEYCGKGYAQGAITELLRYAFEKRGLEEVWAVHLDGNSKMHHILEKSGFRTDRLLRDWYVRDGKRYDMVRMSISYDDYVAASAMAGSNERNGRKMACAGGPALCACA